MSERTALGATMETMTLEEPGVEESSPRVPGHLRCGPCAMWPRQQTWLCAVPLLMGFVGLGLSLMLLKWIVVGSVQDYVPTDLVNAKGIGQDPIFLSKPSVPSKGPDAATMSTTSPGNTIGPIPGSAADGTATVHRTQSGTSSNHSSNSSGARGAGSVEGGSGNRAPHLHNRVGTRGNGTAVPGEKEVTPRSTTVRKPSQGGSRNVYPSSRAVPPSPISITTTTAATTTTVKSTATTQVPPLITTSTRPTQRLNHGRASKGPSTKPTRPHHRFRTLAPTTPTVRSEFFKPCQDSQELAFCLNEGECFIIETVAGVHRHCRCKEGYRGLRCDQFVPKTDPILSNPTADELGIEFMESGETYQRQILSIFSIAMGISLLGLACMALYCRNKRQRGKPRTHQTEIRTLRDCSLIASRLMSKSSPKIDYDLQHQKCCKAHGSSPTPGHSTGFDHSKVSSSNQCNSLAPVKNCSPNAKQKVSNHRPVSRWTPPISRAGHCLTGGSKDYINSYKHLREVESTDATLESLRRCHSQTEGNQYSRSFLNIQTDAFAHSREKLTLANVPCTRLDQGTAFPPPSYRACSVPIIPSVQASNQEDRAEDRSSTMLYYKDGASASQTINCERGSLSDCSQGSHALGNQTKHKSLVTYATALGARTESTMAKTVISMTVLGSGKEHVHHSSDMSKSSGRPEHQHVQSTHEEKEQQGAALHNSIIRRERDCHLSTEPKGLCAPTAFKS